MVASNEFKFHTFLDYRDVIQNLYTRVKKTHMILVPMYKKLDLYDKQPGYFELHLKLQTH